jgi:hypothetical protein
MQSPILSPSPSHLSACDKEGNGKGNKSNGDCNKDCDGDGGKSNGNSNDCNSNEEGKGKGGKRDGHSGKEGDGEDSKSNAQRPKRRNFERDWPQIALKIAPHKKFLLNVQPCSARIAPSSFRNSL